MNVIFSVAVLNGVTRRINESCMRVSSGFEYKLKKLFVLFVGFKKRRILCVYRPCFASWLKKHFHYMSNALVSPHGLKNDEYANLTTVGARE